MKVFRKITLAAVLMTLFSAAYADPPAQSGVVVRDGDFFGTIWVDENAGLMVVFDDVVGFCSDPGFEFTVVPFMAALVSGDFPPNEGRLVYRLRGEIMASVWPIFEFDCDTFLGQLPIADGMVTVSGNDNDLFANLNPGNNINVFKYRAHGFLYTPDGERKRLLFKYNGMWDGEDFSTFTEITRIKLD